MQFHLKILSLTLYLFCAACVNLPPAKYSAPAIVPEAAHPAPMMFSKIDIGLRAGTDVGYVSDFSIDSANWFMIPANRKMLRSGLSMEELDTVFTQVMESMGYDVVDHINLIFEEEIENEMLRAEYRVGGKIIDAKMDVDFDDYDRFGKFISGREGTSGELYLKIKWSVYDTLKRATVYQTTTEGRGEQSYADTEGMILLVNDAFDMAVNNLGADEGFYKLMVEGIKPEGWRAPKDYEDRPLKYEGQEAVEIPPQPLSRTPFSQHSDAIKNAAVLVQGGVGHGSGFFITPHGHILTNQHVVGNAQRVRILTSGKEETLVAQVLRTDTARDVALLRLEDIPAGLKIQTLPVRTAWPAISEDVYAIGAPKNPRLQDTISKGIISAHRPAYKITGTRQDFLQADVPIHGGNSGGPLVDAYGNLVGMSVAGLYMHQGSRSADLNLFIPIEQALDKLNISHSAPLKTSAAAPIKLTK